MFNVLISDQNMSEILPATEGISGRLLLSGPVVNIRAETGTGLSAIFVSEWILLKFGLLTVLNCRPLHFTNMTTVNAKYNTDTEQG